MKLVSSCSLSSWKKNSINFNSFFEWSRPHNYLHQNWIKFSSTPPN